ncbi:MAG: SsrA-binding protein [Deltaproteobacteria bacterium CG11_big_fil_rev_8_21_14_0_20_49_13]|nr:MAG: SsrA-binding protein [Deltaproteobacteria bacterium CG11_big_fil_rev_8_21_14_0_20_49_13]
MSEKIIATNRKASFNYILQDRFETGLVLTGSETKSLRESSANISEAYAMVKSHEIWLVNANISPYEPANYLNHKPKRDRKLLLHKREILKIEQKLKERGLTIVPTKMYFKNGRAKLEIALAKGKRSYDKRDSIKKRDINREVSREFSRRGRT